MDEMNQQEPAEMRVVLLSKGKDYNELLVALAALRAQGIDVSLVEDTEEQRVFVVRGDVATLMQVQEILMNRTIEEQYSIREYELVAPLVWRHFGFYVAPPRFATTFVVLARVQREAYDAYMEDLTLARMEKDLAGDSEETSESTSNAAWSALAEKVQKLVSELDNHMERRLSRNNDEDQQD